MFTAIKSFFVTMLIVFGLAGISELAEAKALPANCQQVLWGFLGSQTRSICDGPIRADGSWMRSRVVFTPAHYVPITCSGYSYISCYGGYYQNYVETDNELYRVDPSNVLGDEPPHLGF